LLFFILSEKTTKNIIICTIRTGRYKKSLTRLHNYDVYRGIKIIDDVENNDENDNQDLLDVLTPKLGEIYNKDKVYPNNSVVITPEQYNEYIRLKSQMEKVNEKVDEVEEVEEDNEDNEVDENVEKKHQ